MTSNRGFTSVTSDNAGGNSFNYVTPKGPPPFVVKGTTNSVYRCKVLGFGKNQLVLLYHSDFSVFQLVDKVKSKYLYASMAMSLRGVYVIRMIWVCTERILQDSLFAQVPKFPSNGDTVVISVGIHVAVMLTDVS